MKKSEILQIIREEVEVILTNEEAIEMFDLDPAALLDEMMKEEEEDEEGYERPLESGLEEEKGCNDHEKTFAQRFIDDRYPGARRGQPEDIKDDKMMNEKTLTSKERDDMSGSDFIFPDGKHFPIPDESHGRNALARANQFSSAPKWYKGSLQSFVSRVHSAVKKKFPGIDTTEKSEKPGKG